MNVAAGLKVSLPSHFTASPRMGQKKTELVSGEMTAPTLTGRLKGPSAHDLDCSDEDLQPTKVSMAVTAKTSDLFIRRRCYLRAPLAMGTGSGLILKCGAINDGLQV